MAVPPHVTTSARAASLDQVQFDNILREVLPSLSRYARSLARDRELAEDLVQDAAVRAWHNRTKFVVGTNFKAWVYRILRNCFISHVRHGKVAKTDTYGDDFPDVPVQSNQEASVFLKDVCRFWTRLAPSQQRAIRLVGIDGRSYEEAACMEEISVGTLKSRVSRGRHTLIALLDGDMVTVDAAKDAQHDQPLSSSDDFLHSAVGEDDRTQIELLRMWRSQRVSIRT